MSACRRRALGLVAVVAVAVGGACGIPIDEDPDVISPEALPDVLVAPADDSSDPVGTPRDFIYLVDETDGPQLRCHAVDVPTVVGTAERARALLDALIAAPSEDLTNRLPGSLQRRSVVFADDAAQVLELSLLGLENTEGENQELAVAQIVFTMTELDGVRGVRFLVGDEPRAVLVEDGQAEAGEVVTRNDFPGYADQLPTARCIDDAANTTPTTEGSQSPATSLVPDGTATTATDPTDTATTTSPAETSTTTAIGQAPDGATAGFGAARPDDARADDDVP